jgi:hypothetical protein
MSAQLESPGTTTLRVTNPGERTVAFCLEPWAREYSLDPHSSFDVVSKRSRQASPKYLTNLTASSSMPGPVRRHVFCAMVSN